MEQPVIQDYINNFKIILSKYLRPNVGLVFNAYNCGEEGAVIELKFKPNESSYDRYYDKDSIAEVLKSVKQNIIAGNLTNVKFGGTNISMQDEGIVIIKDKQYGEWSHAKALEDVNKIVNPPKPQHA